MNNHNCYRVFTHFQHWLGSNYNDLPTDSETMTERAVRYLKEFPDALSYTSLFSPLSPKLKVCAEYIESFRTAYGKNPSVRNVAKALGISPTAAHHRITKINQQSKPKQ